MFSMMTDKDIEIEEAIKEYSHSGQQLEDWMDQEFAWLDDYFNEENARGNIPGPDAEDEKTFKRNRSSE